MRYLFGTGLFAAISAGIALLRGTREAPITWRAVLAWVSWGITLALAIGAIVDTRRDERGEIVAPDSPLAPVQAKRARREEKLAAKSAKR